MWICVSARVDGVLPSRAGDATPPWAAEIDTKVFYADLPGNAGPVGEAAFFHLRWLARGLFP